MASSPAAAFGDATMLTPPDDDGSFWPVTVVLVLLAAATAASVSVGQLFVGPRGLRRTGYDIEAFVVRRCAACLGVADESVQVVRPAERERKTEAGFVRLADGAEEVTLSGAPKGDGDESATSSVQTFP